MYIRKIEIQNIKALHQVTWEVELERAPGWHVILGDNGAGKSTFLRAIALALLGPSEIKGLRLDEDSYLTQGQDEASIELEIHSEKNLDKPKGGGAPGKTAIRPILYLSSENGFYNIKNQKQSLDPYRHIWGGNAGWFSAGFGPFRRFTGGDKENDRLFLAQPKIAAHLSLFGEDVAFTETIRWLHDLNYSDIEKTEPIINELQKYILKNPEILSDSPIDRKLKIKDFLKSAKNFPPPPSFLLSIKNFVNQIDFLPHNTQMADISTQGILFIDGRGAKVSLEDLSDGFRSILSLTLELIRQMERCYGSKSLFLKKTDGQIVINRPGVVLIDEVDAHLHPTWQRRVGPWFRRFFPKVQFFVATHSPWVCQAAEEGSVFWLPAPDSEKEARFLQGVELERILYGDILEAYGTHVFGSVDRSPKAQEMLDTLARLNNKSLHEELTESELEEQQRLSMIFSTYSPPTTPSDHAQRLAKLKARRSKDDAP